MLTFLLLTQGPSPDAILKRVDDYLAKTDSFSVVVQSKFQNRALATSTLRIDRPNRLRIDAKFAATQSRFILNENGGLEVDNSTTFYSKHPSSGTIYLPAFNIANFLSYSVPHIVVRGTTKNSMPGGIRLTSTANQVVNGVKTDLVSGTFQEGQARTTYKFWVDAAGRLLKYYTHSVGPQGTFTLEHTLGKYTPAKFPDSVFSTRLPAGFSPYRLEQHSYALEKGTVVPNIALQSTASGSRDSLRNLASGKNTLVVVLHPRFHANQALIKSLDAVLKRIPDSKVLYVSASKDAAASRTLAPGAYFDPSGSQLERLQVAVTPAILLLDKSGRLVQEFLGFDGKWEGLDEAIATLKGGG